MAEVQRGGGAAGGGPGAGGGLAEVINTILDKGIVIDAWVKVSVVGIEILTVQARVVVASVETYLHYAEAVALTSTAAQPNAPSPA